MSNRLKPRQARPVRPWLATLTSGGEAPPLEPGPGMTDFGDGVIFDPIGNRLLIEVGGGTVLTVSPARKLAETLAHGFTTAATRPTHGRETAPCETCGQPIIHATTHNTMGHFILLDPDPDPAGVWLLVGERNARILQPMETPPGPVYRQHRCERRAE